MQRDAALRQAEKMLEDGADILDIGGESTRPDFTPVSSEEEADRIVPVIEQLVHTFDCPISVDSRKSQVIQAALTAGASIINDIDGLRGDPQMAAVAAASQAGLILMYNPRLDGALPNEAEGLWQTVADGLRASLQIAAQSGIGPNRLMIDPGLGFGMSSGQSLTLQRQFGRLRAFDLPILAAPSRKRFIGELTGRPAASRDFGTAAAVAFAVAAGADFVRVHEVAGMRDVLRVTDALIRPESPDQDGCRPVNTDDRT